MNYESWHANNFTRVHTECCPRRATESTSENPMQLTGTFDSIDLAVANAKSQDHRVGVCKLCCPDFAHPTLVQIAVDVNGFEGDCLILERSVVPVKEEWLSKSFSGNQRSVDVPPGPCTFHIRGGIGGCYFYFEVDRSGVISHISAPESAESDSSTTQETLKLKTTEVAIHPARYSGEFVTNLKPWDQWQAFGQAGYNCAHFKAIIGMLLCVWNGNSRGGGLFGATPLPDGSVECKYPDTALGGVGTLTLQTAEVSMIASPSDPWHVSGYGDITDEQTIHAIRGLRLEIRQTKVQDRPAILFKPY